MMQDFYPGENVTIYNVSSHRNMQIVGIDEGKTAEYSTLCLAVDWSAKDAVVETEKDRLMRQKEAIEDTIKKIEKDEYRKKMSDKMKKKNADKRKRKYGKKEVAQEVAPQSDAVLFE